MGEINELMEFKLKYPLTEEELDKIYDVDLDHTNRLWFDTKHGKCIEFVKKDYLVEILEDLKSDDYYRYCQTGCSRLSERDWDWLIYQVRHKNETD